MIAGVDLGARPRPGGLLLLQEGVVSACRNAYNHGTSLKSMST